jgi:hypothetical protein
VNKRHLSIQNKTFIGENKRWTNLKPFQGGPAIFFFFDGMIALGRCSQLDKSGLDQSDVQML